MMIRNEDIKELIMEIPEGHLHIRTTLVLQDDTTITLQEAAVANLVRAYITVKTHPTRHSMRLKLTRIEAKKEGYAEWQLLEDEG
jgi:hypothetical protein